MRCRPPTATARATIPARAVPPSEQLASPAVSPYLDVGPIEDGSVVVDVPELDVHPRPGHVARVALVLTLVVHLRSGEKGEVRMECRGTFKTKVSRRSVVVVKKKCAPTTVCSNG